MLLMVAATLNNNIISIGILQLEIVLFQARVLTELSRLEVCVFSFTEVEYVVLTGSIKGL